MSYTGDYTEGLKNKVTGERLFPNVPKTLNMSANLVTTQYGAQFGGQNSSYNWKLLESHPWTGYTVKIFCYGQQNVTSLETIRDYMKFITGSDYIPRYENHGANDVYICLLAQNISDEDRFWKYQYVEGYGLLAFRVDNFPFALKSQIPTIPQGIPSMRSDSFDLNYGKDHYQGIEIPCSENSVVHLILTHYEDASAINEFATVYVINGVRYVETSSQHFSIAAYATDHLEVEPDFGSDIGTVELRYILISSEGE